MRTLISIAVAMVLVSNSSFVLAKNPHGEGKGLPPGLQKKVNKGGTLPPGWQKKLVTGRILDIHVYKLGTIIVPPDPLGILTIQVDNRILKIHKDTRKIINILK